MTVSVTYSRVCPRDDHGLAVQPLAGLVDGAADVAPGAEPQQGEDGEEEVEQELGQESQHLEKKKRCVTRDT